MRSVSVFATIFTILVLSFSLVTVVTAASVARNMPKRVSPGESFSVEFKVTNAVTGKLFILEDKLPQGFSFNSWDVSGAAEPKESIKTRFLKDEQKYAWSFTPTKPTVSIKYTTTAPTATGEYFFDAIWFDPNGQSRNKEKVVVRVITCGDGFCEGGETESSCPKDCEKAAPTKEKPPKEEVKEEAPPTKEKPPKWIGLVIVVVLLLVAALIYYFMREKPPKQSEKSE